MFEYCHQGSTFWKPDRRGEPCATLESDGAVLVAQVLYLRSFLGNRQLSSGGGRDSLAVLIGAHIRGDGAAGLFEAGEIPEVGEVAALLGFYRLDGAVAPIQKNAFAPGLVIQSQTGPVRGQASELLNEIGFTDTLEVGQTRNFRVGQAYLTRPLATGRAALAFVEDGHWWGGGIRL